MGRRAEGWPRPSLSSWAAEWKLLSSLGIFVTALCSFDRWLTVPVVIGLLIGFNLNEVGEDYGNDRDEYREGAGRSTS